MAWSKMMKLIKKTRDYALIANSDSHSSQTDILLVSNIYMMITRRYADKGCQEISLTEKWGTRNGEKKQSYVGCGSFHHVKSHLQMNLD